MNNSYPFPTRNESYSENNCYYIKPDFQNFEEANKVYLRKLSQESINIKLQYFSVEKELLNSFQFVNPVEQNLKTSSVKFATMIRESSSLFEQISRIIYQRLFKDFEGINIYNYLSLDKFLKFNSLNFSCPTLKNISDTNDDLLRPFKCISSWNGESKLENKHIPIWWNAFNKIKHSPNELTEFSTLENAIQSLLASYIIITKYLGSGVVSGDLSVPEKNSNEIIHRQLRVEQSELFFDWENSIGFVL